MGDSVNSCEWITIERDGTSAAVDPMGAQLMSLARDGIEYLWQGDERWWPRRAPVLFPIVGSLRDGRAETERGEAVMAQHGVARGQRFSVAEKGPDFVTMVLEANDETRAAYPYDFRLSMTYTVLEGGAVEQAFVVENTDDAPLPFVVGGHPAFNVPLVEGEGFEDYELAFEFPWSWDTPTLGADKLLHWDEPVEVVRDSDVLPIRRSLFDTDTVVLKDVPGNGATLRSRVSGHGVTLDFPGFEYCGVWSAQPDAPFVAVEPWTGCATGSDEGPALTDKRGMTELEPGGTWRRAFTMRPF